MLLEPDLPVQPAIVPVARLRPEPSAQLSSDKTAQTRAADTKNR